MDFSCALPAKDWVNSSAASLRVDETSGSKVVCPTCPLEAAGANPAAPVCVEGTNDWMLDMRVKEGRKKL
jgi:hypothetical protein